MRCRTIVSAVGLATVLVSCSPDPATLLTLEFTGSLDDEKVRDAIVEGAHVAARGATHTKPTYADGVLTVEVAPVVDVRAYVARLSGDLQRVNEAPMGARFLFSIDLVEGRTVRVSIQ